MKIARGLCRWWHGVNFFLEFAEKIDILRNQTMIMGFEGDKENTRIPRDQSRRFFVELFLRQSRSIMFARFRGCEIFLINSSVW